jgi:hypothetical protein
LGFSGSGRAADCESALKSTAVFRFNEGLYVLLRGVVPTSVSCAAYHS